MRRIACITTSAIYLMTLPGCGGGGGGTGADISSNATPSLSEPLAPSADAQKTQTQKSNPPPRNPLGLNPVPQFTPSSRTVVYDDCFPKYDDVKVGDVTASKAELYFYPGEIYTDEFVETVTNVSDTTFDGRPAINIVTDSAPHIGPKNSLVLGAEVTRLALHGGTRVTNQRHYVNDAFGTRSVVTYVPSMIGNLSTGHGTTPFRLGDSVTQSYSWSIENIYNPETNSHAQVTEKITFIGVEEGTQVDAGVFDYSCVFRQELTICIGEEIRTGVNDIYTHRWAERVKGVQYSAQFPRPLIKQLVSDSAMNRRKETARY